MVQRHGMYTKVYSTCIIILLKFKTTISTVHACPASDVHPIQIVAPVLFAPVTVALQLQLDI